jgi:hypothetical protein
MHASIRNTVVRGFAVALVAAGLGLALPSSAQAEDRAERGAVVIDAGGVHLYLSAVYHYSHDDYPRARGYFEHNDHVRTIQNLERKQRKHRRLARQAADNGRYRRARRLRSDARVLERYRQRQLRMLEADRVTFERIQQQHHARAERRAERRGWRLRWHLWSRRDH